MSRCDKVSARYALGKSLYHMFTLQLGYTFILSIYTRSDSLSEPLLFVTFSAISRTRVNMTSGEHMLN